MKGRPRGSLRTLAAVFAIAAPGVVAALVVASFEGCSSNPPGAAAGDGGTVHESDARADAPATDASDSASGAEGGGEDAGDAAAEASVPTVTGMAIATPDGGLQGAPGDAIQLSVILSMSDGTSRAATVSEVRWISPLTLVAENPYEAGAADILPEPGTQPTAFFVRNDYAQTNPGVLYVMDPGTVSSPTITVTASVLDAGDVSTTVAILPALVGDATNGANLFLHGPECAICHGATGGGSPALLLSDGGLELVDGGPVYAISGQDYPYPAPGLDDAPDSGNLASDPAWNAALLGIAAQSDMDNHGVALRPPMPDWFGGTNATGGTLRGQDFADIYAWLKTQTP